MEVKDARCTNCGASLKVEPQKTITTCEYCHSDILISGAIELALVEVDKTKDLERYRSLLKDAIQKNSINEILTQTRQIKDILPSDFTVNYYFAYAKQAQNEPSFMKAFLTSNLPATLEEINNVVNHIIHRSELRDKPVILSFLNRVNPESIGRYEAAHKSRAYQENQYANITRDVFICHSSHDRTIAEKIVDTLEKEGFNCWISTRNLRPEDSENYWENITKAIKNTKLLIVVSSESAMLSKDVQREIEISQELKQKRFEYKIDNTSQTVLFKYLFDGVKWVDGISDPIKNINKLPKRVFEELYQEKFKDTKNNKSFSDKYFLERNNKIIEDIELQKKENSYNEISIEHLDQEKDLNKTTSFKQETKIKVENENSYKDIDLEHLKSEDESNKSSEFKQKNQINDYNISNNKSSNNSIYLIIFIPIFLLLFLFPLISGIVYSNNSFNNYEIAMITDAGDIDDESFNQGTWEGIVEYAEENDLTHKYYKPAEVSDEAYGETIDLAIEAGAKIVITPGFLFESAVYAAQTKYPEVMFVLIDGVPQPGDYTTFEVADNTVSILFDEHESGFLAGYAAVKDGYTDLGFMGGIAVPAVVRFGIGFIAGAYYAADELDVTISFPDNRFEYLGNFSPSDAHKTKALAWYDEGTEIIFAVAGGAGSSVMSAAEDADAMMIGVEVDQNGLSESVLTSAMKDLSVAVQQALEAFYADNFPGGEIQQKNATVGGVALPMDTSRFATFSQAAYDAIYAELADGTIDVPSDYDELRDFLNFLGYTTEIQRTTVSPAS